MEIKERLINFLKEIKVGQTAFEQKVGISRGSLAKKSGLTADSLAKIAIVYSELNLEWLISGKGKMIKDESSVTNEELKELKARIEYLEVNIEMWQTTSARKEIEINKLKTENQILMDKIKSLESKEAI